jgi:hypothetical protein
MNPRITRPRAAVAGGAAVVLAAAVAVSLSLPHSTSAAGPANKPGNARLASSSCTGPAGAAYIATAGYQAFDAVDTNNCYEVQQYNVADPPVPNTGTSDSNYSSTDEGIAMYGNTLYFADTGNDTVAVVPSQSLNPADYVDTPETLIPVGVNP